MARPRKDDTTQPAPSRELVGIVCIELTINHPAFNKKTGATRHRVSAKLAQKGIDLGHFKLVE